MKMSGEKKDSKKKNLKSMKKLHGKCKEYMFFQLYTTSEFIYDRYGLDALKEYFKFNQDSVYNLKMKAFYKMMEGIITKLPKSLKIKEGIKMFMGELEFIEDLENVKVLESSKEKGIFEITNCSLRKEYNKLAKKAKKDPDLIDICCLWCYEGIPMAQSYGVDYEIKLTDKGCLNILS